MKYCYLLLCFLLYGQIIYAQSLDDISKQKPLSIHGGVNMRAMFYDVSGIPARRQPFTYILSGSLETSLYGISIPVSFILSEQERSFRQPFNQFGMSPTYKWITLHAGYRNISFSPFTLDGYTMLGAGFEVRPGKWHVGMMYGRLNRAITANQTSGDLQPVSFSRKGLAGKIGYGNDTTNVAFTFIKAKDDAGSLDLTGLDSTYLSPAENFVASLGGRIGFRKHFFVDAEGALSLYTRNINSDIQIDTASIDIPASVNSLMTINASTELSTAVRAAIGYQDKRFGLSLQYRRIDPNYQSMGAYFFQNDLENYTINPTLIFWQQKIRVTGSVGLQRDNLSGQKQATAQRTISSANISANLTQRFGVDANYSNYATSQNPVAIKLNDSLRVAQTTQNFTVTPHYFITGELRNHIFTLSVNSMTLNDYSLLSTQRHIIATTALFNYQITFNKRGLSVFAGLTNTSLKTAVLTSGNRGLTFGGGKNFLSNTLQLRLTNSILKNIQGELSNMLYTHGLSATYRPARRHAFNLNVNYINNLGSAQTQEVGGYPRYREWRGEVAYNLSF